MDELLSLKWNNHRTTFLHILGVLRDKQQYTDVTLACEGKFYSVHKLVLSTCSDYFSAIFDRTTCKNPIIVLKDIKCEDLEALLDYMYLGEVNVRQADLASLIKAAECLQVKGLAVPDDEPPRRTGNVRRTSDGLSSPPAKRKRKEEEEKKSSNSNLPKSPQVNSRLSPSHQDSVPSPGDTSKESQNPRVSQSNSDYEVYVKQEKDENETSNDVGDSYNMNNDGFKEEADDDPGELSNELPEFLNASDSQLQSGSFSSSSYPSTSAFQPGDVSGWQGEGSNLNFPANMNFGASENSSQNSTGRMRGWESSMHSSTLEQQQQHEEQHQFYPRSSSQCVVCKKRFFGVNQKYVLKRHMITHSGYKPYQCPLCAHRSNIKQNLIVHIKRKHSVTLARSTPATLQLPPRQQENSQSLYSTLVGLSAQSPSDSHEAEN